MIKGFPNFISASADGGTQLREVRSWADRWQLQGSFAPKKLEKKLKEPGNKKETPREFVYPLKKNT
jgi:hypothetical protein